MSPVAWVLLAVAVTLAIVAGSILVVTAVYGSRRSRGVEMHTDGSWDHIRLRTPAGPASARLVLHEDHGRVYAVSTRFRGEAEQIGYVPPAPAQVMTFVTRLANEHTERRTALKRGVARMR